MNQPTSVRQQPLDTFTIGEQTSASHSQSHDAEKTPDDMSIPKTETHKGNLDGLQPSITPCSKNNSEMGLEGQEERSNQDFVRALKPMSLSVYLDKLKPGDAKYIFKRYQNSKYEAILRCCYEKFKARAEVYNNIALTFVSAREMAADKALQFLLKHQLITILKETSEDGMFCWKKFGEPESKKISYRDVLGLAFCRLCIKWEIDLDPKVHKDFKILQEKFQAEVKYWEGLRTYGYEAMKQRESKNESASGDQGSNSSKECINSHNLPSLDPKSASAILEVLQPNRFKKKINRSRFGGFSSFYHFENKEFQGQGKTNIGASHAAAERVLKHLYKEPLTIILNSASTWEEADKDDTEEGPKQKRPRVEQIYPIPWEALASLALYNLCKDWEVYTEKDLEDLAQKKEGKGKSLTEIYEEHIKRECTDLEPCTMLEKLLEERGIMSDTLYKETNEGWNYTIGNFEHVCSITLSGNEYIRRATKKKEAKKEAAILALIGMGIIKEQEL